MRKLFLVLTIAALVTGLLMTAGCLPEWVIGVSKYTQSNFLYRPEDLDSPSIIAAEDNTFLIFKVALTYNGPAVADIRDSLIFAVYDSEHSTVKYENYYEDSPFDVYDDIDYILNPEQTNSGSIFVLLPGDYNPATCTFKIMLPDLSVLFSAHLADIPYVTGYPASW